MSPSPSSAPQVSAEITLRPPFGVVSACVASRQPSTAWAYSITACWKPPQVPKKGTPFSRAWRIAPSAPARLRYGLPGTHQRPSNAVTRSALAASSLGTHSCSTASSRSSPARCSAIGIARCATTDSLRSPTRPMRTAPNLSSLRRVTGVRLRRRVGADTTQAARAHAEQVDVLADRVIGREFHGHVVLTLPGSRELERLRLAALVTYLQDDRVVAAARRAVRRVDRAFDLRDGVALLGGRADRRLAGLRLQRRDFDGHVEIAFRREVHRLRALRQPTATPDARESFLLGDDACRRATAVGARLVRRTHDREEDEPEAGCAYTHRLSSQRRRAPLHASAVASRAAT